MSSSKINEANLLEELFNAGCHWGHKSASTNPNNKEFIWGKNNNMDIIDLRITIQKLKLALAEVERVVSNGGKVIIIGTKSFASKQVKDFAEKSAMPFVNRRWLGGTLTNFKTIKQSVKKLVYLESMIANNKFDNLTKKERLMQERKCRDLTANLGGLRDLQSLPDMLFVLDAKHDYIAVREANKLGIPVVAVVDTNTSPEGINYGIPGNDDSMKAIELYLKLITESILAGAAKIKVEKKVMQPKAGAAAKKPAATAKTADTTKRVVTVKKSEEKQRVVTVKADKGAVEAKKSAAKTTKASEAKTAEKTTKAKPEANAEKPATKTKEAAKPAKKTATAKTEEK